MSGRDFEQLLFGEDGSGWRVGLAVLVAHETAQGWVVLFAAGGVVHCRLLVVVGSRSPFRRIFVGIVSGGATWLCNRHARQ